jgi:hypothetical protein
LPTLAVDFRSAMVASVTSTDEPTSCTRMMAISPSSLIALPAYSLKGLSAESTPSTCEMAVTSFSIVAFSSVMDDPAGATTTAVALAPATDGNTAVSRSSASCDSVPGMTNDSWVCPPRAMPPPSAPTMSSSHTPMTRHGRRYAKRPKR